MGKPGFCNRIAKDTSSACAMGVCKKLEFNPQVNRWFFINAHSAMTDADYVISIAKSGSKADSYDLMG